MYGFLLLYIYRKGTGMGQNIQLETADTGKLLKRFAIASIISLVLNALYNMF